MIRSRGPIRPVIPRGWLDVDINAVPHTPSYWIDEDRRDLRRVPTGIDFLLPVDRQST